MNEIRLILREKKLLILRKRNGKEKKNFGENAKIVRRNEKVVERQARAALCRSTSKIRTKDKSGEETEGREAVENSGLMEHLDEFRVVISV